MKNFDYKKSLGQNFLIDKNIIEKISSSINPNKDDLIIEIGPGAGALTKKLLEKDCDIICFEIDTRLKEQLESIQTDNMQLVFEDFLKVDLNKYIDYSKYKNIYFIGNLPYYITTAIINKITNESKPYQIIIMIQKEVAERFNAKIKTKDYSSISVFLQYNFNIEKVCNVSNNCFEPVPKVDSAVLKLTKHNKYNVNNEEKFYKLVKDSFNHKRKNLRNNLYNYDLNKIENILSKYNKNLTNRAEEITIKEFIDISNNL